MPSPFKQTPTREQIMRAAFIAHRCSARQRGVEFLLSFEEWCDFWGDDFEIRGKTRHGLVMSRLGDTGPYAVGNIKKITSLENLSEGSAKRMAAPRSKRFSKPVKTPKKKPINTPAGWFESLTDAANYYGITRQAMFFRMKTYPASYSY